MYVLLRWGASLQVIYLLQQHCYWQTEKEGSLLFSLCFCEYLLFERCHCLHFSGWACPFEPLWFDSMINSMILLSCELKSSGSFHFFPEWKKQTCGLEVPVLYLNKSITFVPGGKLHIKQHRVEFAASWRTLCIGIHQHIPTVGILVTLFCYAATVLVRRA